MEIVDPRIAEYVERMSSPHEPLLAELSEETRASQTSSAMLTGPGASMQRRSICTKAKSSELQR